MPTHRQKYERFRALHERPGIFVIPNPWDAGSAKILTALGFEALATTSAGYAFSAGLPDSAAAITREHLLENARYIAQATHLPVSADLQNGFGSSPDTCVETVLLASKIGLVGGSIEDATGDPENPIYELNHAIDRVAAAAEAAHDSHFFLTARAENFLYGRDDLNDTICRLQSFGEAGADVLYAPGLSNLEAIQKVCSAVSKPVNVLMGLKGASYSIEQLASAGAKRISVGGSLARAALGALVQAGLEIKEQGTFTYADEALSHADITAIMSRPTSL
jgi:2-methylisocitrate lyase-like PEP mutase family enzyme